MLSFQEIGPAAMLSRATAGVAGGCAIFLLPGSEHAVRLAMERLILPELGHIVRELTRSTNANMRPLRSTIAFAEALRDASSMPRAPIARTETRPAARGRRPRRRSRRRRDRGRAAVRSRGDGRLRGDRRRHDGRERDVAAHARGASTACSRGQMPPRAARAGRVHRDRDRRADAGGRRRGRDGRGDRRATATTCASLAPVYAAAERRAPRAPTSQRAMRSCRAGAGAQPEPHRRARGDRRDARRGLRQAARSRMLSTGNEIVEPGHAARAGADLRHQSLHARGDRRGDTAASRSRMPTAGDTIDALAARARRGAVAHDLVVFSGGSSVGDRDLILDVLRAARRACSFTASRSSPASRRSSARIGGTPVFGMPGYPTSCLSNAYMLLVPFLRKMARLPPWEPRTIDAAARPPHRLSRRPPSVLHGAHRGRPRRTRVQGVGRHHEHGERRRLHRDSARTWTSSKRAQSSP